MVEREGVKTIDQAHQLDKDRIAVDHGLGLRG